MYGSCLIICVCAAYLFSCIDEPTYEDLICTNCMFITITEKYFCSHAYKFMNKYYLTIEANNTYFKREKLGTSSEYSLDKELIKLYLVIFFEKIYISRFHLFLLQKINIC